MYEPERAVSARHSFAGEGRNPSTPPAFYYRRHHHHCHHYTHSHHHHSRRHHHLFIQEVRRLERKVLKMGKALKKLGLMEDKVVTLVVILGGDRGGDLDGDLGGDPLW